MTDTVDGPPAYTQFESVHSMVTALESILAREAQSLQELRPLHDRMPDVYLINALETLGMVRAASEQYLRIMTEYAATREDMVLSDRRIAKLAGVTNKTVARWRDNPLPASELIREARR